MQNDQKGPIMVSYTHEEENDEIRLMIGLN